MKTTLFIAALLGLTALVPTISYAADLAGDCCSDLEQRVADLEATAAKHGNRKMSLTITGVLDEVVENGTIQIGGSKNTATHILANPSVSDPNLIAFQAEGSANVDWHVGSVIELELPPLGLMVSPVVRQEYVYVSSKLVKVSLGQRKEASAGLEQEGPVDLIAVAPMLDISNLAPFGVPGGELFGGQIDTNGRVDIFPLPGLMLSGSYSPEAGTNAVKDLAVRFATKIGKTVDVEAAAGYRVDDASGDKVLKASGGIHDSITGLFAQGAYARDDLTGIWGWQAQGGIAKQFFIGVGDTILYGEYGRLTGVPGTGNPNFVGGGMVQQFDAAASEVFAGYRHYLADDAASDEATVIIGGVRVHF